MATLGLTPDEQKAVEQFRKDVVEPSMTNLVVLDFWAEWCGPCKALMPVIEKVTADYAHKGVKLVKINVDENGFIASQFQVRSIPTVYAIFKGQPVADLTNARTESQLSQLLDQILRQLPVEGEAQAQAADIAPLLAMGEEVLATGDHERAISIFSQIIEMAPDSVDAQAGLVRALAASGDAQAAEQILAALPEDLTKDAAFDRARSAITLAKDAPKSEELSGALAEAEAKLGANPDDHQAKLDYATTAFAAGERDKAADALLASIAADREWNEGAARAKLLSLFEVVGLEDPWVATQRRRLSALLFG